MLQWKKLIVNESQNILLKNKSKNTKEKWVRGLMIIKACTFVKILLINQFVTLI